MMHHLGMNVLRECGGMAVCYCTAIIAQAGSLARAAIGRGAAPPPGFMWNS
jgi:hypothetical protein